MMDKPFDLYRETTEVAKKVLIALSQDGNGDLFSAVKSLGDRLPFDLCHTEISDDAGPMYAIHMTEQNRKALLDWGQTLRFNAIVCDADEHGMSWGAIVRRLQELIDESEGE